jgi:hypothetical protein
LPESQQPVEVAASQTAPTDAHDVQEVDLSDEWLSVLKEVSTDKPEHPPEAAPSSNASPEFEISTEPVSVEDESEPAVHAHSEPVHPPSPLVPPPEMPAYAEFQVNSEPPSPVIEESDFTSEFKVEVPSPAELHAAVAPPSASEHVSAQSETPVQELPPLEEIGAPESSAPVEEAPHMAEVPVNEEPEFASVETSHTPQEISSPKQQPKPESEFELDEDYELILDPEALVPAYDQKPPDVPIEVHEAEPEPELEHAGRNSAARPGAGDFASDQFLADLASEIEHLGKGGALTPAFSTAATEAPVKMQDTANLSDSGPLKEVFDNFRAELGEMGSEDEDLETHYNLGTAFREMGLLEEAISEFQKVAKANQSGRPFRYAMQCCTLLGLAFMEKGQPGIAAIWYERALETPGVEPESILALRYDLGIAQESAGEPEAALKSFSKVYAMNIDYRDVAERIAALQKPSSRR